ncbi:DUF6228 family protein [Streptomyces sp. 3214.6]|uniref:DUF6228 family protein n=1 Tax=Streptomyces sp. 3214.6 TaxID=1882757 RepID=UPI00090B4C96|nr:DUF6228 family protein [Streptomyces sp. 3214.6]SHI03968.1 hypothetical protein SAMN05444521_3433 [Streptomyces sp. 3214.6]
MSLGNDGCLVVRAGGLLFSEPARPFEDEPTLDFLVRACGPWGSIETSVRTWDGDRLDVFLDSLVDDFRGWAGARTWHSLSYYLTLSAEHRSGGHVHLTWGIHDQAPSEGWHFETTTVHAAGEDMRTLAAETHTFLRSVANQPER